jgi:hypothetical protein
MILKDCQIISLFFKGVFDRLNQANVSSLKMGRKLYGHNWWEVKSLGIWWIWASSYVIYLKKN